jgi:hypothetical protein
VAIVNINAGDTAWVLASTAPVMFMTPGLAFFYGGMVRARNVLTMLMQNFFCLVVRGGVGRVGATGSGQRTPPHSGVSIPLGGQRRVA